MNYSFIIGNEHAENIDILVDAFANLWPGDTVSTETVLVVRTDNEDLARLISRLAGTQRIDEQLPRRSCHMHAKKAHRLPVPVPSSPTKGKGEDEHAPAGVGDMPADTEKVETLVLCTGCQRMVVKLRKSGLCPACVQKKAGAKGALPADVQERIDRIVLEAKSRPEPVQMPHAQRMNAVRKF